MRLTEQESNYNAFSPLNTEVFLQLVQPAFLTPPLHALSKLGELEEVAATKRIPSTRINYGLKILGIGLTQVPTQALTDPMISWVKLASL